MKQTQMKVGTKLFDLSRTLPLVQQDWRNHLVVVTSLPTRWVGLVSATEQIKPTFTLHGALEYVSQYRFELAEEPKPGEPPRLRPMVQPRMTLPWELFHEPIKLKIQQWTHLFVVRHQPENVRNYFYEAYQHCFDPPKIERPSLITPNGEPA